MVTRRMKPEVKQKWVTALRSGKYTQGKAMLRQEVKIQETGAVVKLHCCLGVLCELYMDDTHESIPMLRELPPSAVLEWAGLNTAQPGVCSRSGLNLAALNDGYRVDNTIKGLTFDEIADLIEEEF